MDKKPSLLAISRPYITPGELSQLHLLTIDADKKILYNQKKHQIFQFLFQVVKVLKFPLRVLSTAMIYYQKFYLASRFYDIDEFDDDKEKLLENDPFTVSLACLLLAGKNEDCIKKLRDIQAVANKVKEYNDDPELQRKIILTIEVKLLNVLKFNFNNNALILPSLDNLVVQFAKIKKLTYKQTMFSWIISVDLMSTPVNLILPPHCIALGILIVATNMDTTELSSRYSADEEVTDRINLHPSEFNCPELLVNEAVIYILDYYIHQYDFLMLKEYLPAVNTKLNKSQIFQFMNLKSSKFNSLKLINEVSCSKRLMDTDEYLKLWDYSVASKGTARFILGNKRRRFNRELDELKSK